MKATTALALAIVGVAVCGTVSFCVGEYMSTAKIAIIATKSSGSWSVYPIAWVGLAVAGIVDLALGYIFIKVYYKEVSIEQQKQAMPQLEA